MRTAGGVGGGAGCGIDAWFLGQEQGVRRRSFAVLTERWKALEHVTLSPRRITQIARATLAFTRFERSKTN